MQNHYSIHNVFERAITGSIRKRQSFFSNRSLSSEGPAFEKILASLQASPAKNVYKTRGLTIADYRAQAIISRSSNRSHTAITSMILKKPGLNLFAGHWISATGKSGSGKAHSPSVQKTKGSLSVEKRNGITAQQQVGLTEQKIIEQNIKKAAAKYDLPPNLIKGVIRAESNFKVTAVSLAGAKGLMQLMPATAKELGVKNPFDIEQNINGGTRYLRKMLDRFGGDVKLALAAYNAGPETVKKYGGNVPFQETKQYVARVLRFSKQTV